MWLINTETLRLCQVSNCTDKKYAILSHTCDQDNEISFQEIQDYEKFKNKTGFHKVKKTCDIAQSKGYEYAWIDTCCIDKTSSAELGEAINSMYAWYKQAEVCYVFLSDFEPLPAFLREQRAMIVERLGKCRWFTRGWTLQELIAPTKMEFFDRRWNFIGAKNELKYYLSQITNIDGYILENSAHLDSLPVARRMSWAAGRRTTRIEDRAYSLLGIFGINMPLLYGEGEKAFLRLQRQIASEKNDLSLFAWQYTPRDDKDEGPQFSGIFADSPDDFCHCSGLKRPPDQSHNSREFSITNAGLRMEDILHSLRLFRGSFILDLNCAEISGRTGGSAKWLGIRLKKIGNTLFRAKPSSMELATSRNRWFQVTAKHVPQPVYIQTVLQADDAQRISSLPNGGVMISYTQSVAERMVQQWGLPRDSCVHATDKKEFFFGARGRDNFLAILHFSLEEKNKSLFQTSAIRDKIRSERSKNESAIVCALQWTGFSYQFFVALFGVDDLLESTANISDEEFLGICKDRLFIESSDASGLFLQRNMPTRKTVYLGGRHHVLAVRQGRYLRENEEESLPERDGCYHVIVRFVNDMKL